METKACRECHKEYSIESFRQESDGYPRWVCQPCENERLKAFRRKANEAKATRPYPTDNRCELCEKISYKRLHYDHDHLTGEFRGWWCDNCNRGVGHLKDDPVVMRKAADIIENARQKTTIQTAQTPSRCVSSDP